MAATSFVAGTVGYVQIGSLTTLVYAYKKWQLAMKAALPKCNNFKSGYQILVGGIISGTLTLEGPLDVGNGMGALACGQSYTFVLGISSAISFSVVAFVGDITPSDDVEDAPRISVTAETSGSFTASIA